MRHKILLGATLLAVPLFLLSWETLGFAHSRAKFCEETLKREVGQDFPMISIEGIVTKVDGTEGNRTVTIALTEDKNTDGKFCRMDDNAIGSEVLVRYMFQPVVEQEMPEGGDAGMLGE